MIDTMSGEFLDIVACKLDWQTPLQHACQSKASALAIPVKPQPIKTQWSFGMSHIFRFACFQRNPIHHCNESWNLSQVVHSQPISSQIHRILHVPTAIWWICISIISRYILAMFAMHSHCLAGILLHPQFNARDCMQDVVRECEDVRAKMYHAVSQNDEGAQSTGFFCIWSNSVFFVESNAIYFDHIDPVFLLNHKDKCFSDWPNRYTGWNEISHCIIKHRPVSRNCLNHCTT